MRSLKSYHKGLFISLFSMFSIFVSYQNCSSKYLISEVIKPVIAESLVEPQYLEVNLNERTEFPKLKLFFIVDNSGTMLKNQLNLSNSFSAMFSGEDAKNLTPFSAEIFLFSTSQNTDLALPSDLLLKKTPSFNFTPPFDLKEGGVPFLMAHRGEYAPQNNPNKILSGYISGDIMGFQRISKTDNSSTKNVSATNHTFLPAPVLFLDLKNDKIDPSVSLIKEPEMGAEVITDQFQKNLDVLNPKRSLGLNQSTNSDGSKSGEFEKIVSNESGLCAMARILRNSNSYIKEGEINSFIIVSDENDNDPYGKNCIQSITDTTSSFKDVQYVNLRCQSVAQNTIVTYNTKFAFNVNTDRIPSKCPIKFYYEYQFTYTVKTEVLVPIKTHIKYWTANAEICDLIDGVKFNCRIPPPSLHEVDKEGNFVSNDNTNNCLSQALPIEAITQDPQFQAQCTKIPGSSYFRNDSRTVNVNASNKKYPFDYYQKNNSCPSEISSLITENNYNNDCKISDEKWSTDSNTYKNDQASDQRSCESLAKDYCASHSSYLNCVAGVFAPAVNAKVDSRTKATTESQDLNCSSSCSGTKLCGNKPLLSVSEYLKSVNTSYIDNSCITVYSNLSKSYTPVRSYEAPGRYEYRNNEVIQSPCLTDEISVIINGPYSDPDTFSRKVDFVTGTNNEDPNKPLPKQKLVEYIQSRTNELMNGNLPLLSLFVLQPNDVAGDGETPGLEYNRLADLMNGKKESVLSQNYSPALGGLAGVIKSRIERTIMLPQIGKAKIYRVWKMNPETKEWETSSIPSQYWSQSGTALIFNENYPLKLIDQFKIEYY